MSWPQRVECSEVTWPRLDFVKMGDLTFRAPDEEKYPSLTMGYSAGGGLFRLCVHSAPHTFASSSTRLVSVPPEARYPLTFNFGELIHGYAGTL